MNSYTDLLGPQETIIFQDLLARLKTEDWFLRLTDPDGTPFIISVGAMIENHPPSDEHCKDIYQARVRVQWNGDETAAIYVRDRTPGSDPDPIVNVILHRSMVAKND